MVPLHFQRVVWALQQKVEAQGKALADLQRQVAVNHVMIVSLKGKNK